MSSSKKIDLKRTLRQVFICLRPRTPYPPPLTPCKRVYSILIQTGKGGKGGEFNQREGYRGSFTVPATRNSTDQQAVPANLFRNSCKN